MTEWKSAALDPQAEFFSRHVAPVVEDGRTKVVVIISDGMRYEIAEQLASMIRSEDRFDAYLSAVLGSPYRATRSSAWRRCSHSRAWNSPRGACQYSRMAKPTNGTANRDKILQTFNGHAMKAANVPAMTSSELRELYPKHQIFYVYHDRIDAVGDSGFDRRDCLRGRQRDPQ